MSRARRVFSSLHLKRKLGCIVWISVECVSVCAQSSWYILHVGYNSQMCAVDIIIIIIEYMCSGVEHGKVFFFSVFEQKHYLYTHKNTWNRSILRIRCTRAYRTLKTNMPNTQNMSAERKEEKKKKLDDPLKEWHLVPRPQKSNIKMFFFYLSTHWTIWNDCQLIGSNRFFCLCIHILLAPHSPKWSNGVCIDSMVNNVKFFCLLWNGNKTPKSDICGAMSTTTI